TEIPGNVPRPGLSRTGCAFAPRCPRAQARCTEERPELAAQPGSLRTAACFYPHDGVLQ
ncbi:MAG: ABC transporter ATP-binding protein, partial [Lysobacteraceae bacterium]